MIGSSGNRIGGRGLVLSNVTGSLDFANAASGTISAGDLDIYSTGAALLVTGTGGFTLNTTPNAATLDASGGPAADVSSAAVDMQLSSLTSTNSTTTGVSLTTVTGTFSAPAGSSITNATSTDFLISGGTANVTYGGTITDDLGQLISISGTTGGTKTFTGAITDGDDVDGSCISLTSNTGATIRFSGGLVLSTGANPAFTATGGGTIEVCDENPCNPAATGALINKLTTTTATALNVAGTTIGSNNLEFRSITSNGGSSTGIILDTTGATGGLKVKGTGSAGSGGTIANKTGSDLSTTTGIGIYLNDTGNVSLSRMQLNDFQNFGIRGKVVNNFSMDNCVVNGANGTAASLASPENYGEGSVYFGNTTTNGLTGNGIFTNNSISGGRARNMSIVNGGGASTTTLTVKGSTFGAMQNFSNGNQSFAVEPRTTGSTFNVIFGGMAVGEGNTMTNAVSDLANFTGQTGTTMDVQFTNNTLSNNNANNIIGGGSLVLASQGVMTFNVSNNTMRDADGSAITLFKASAGTSLTGTVNSNTIGVSGVTDSGSKSGNGIFVSAAGTTGTMGFTITNNQIHQIHGNAHIFADNTGGSYTANFTIMNNIFDTPGAGWFAGVAVTNGSPTSSDTINVCAKIEQNTFNLGGNLGVIVGASGAATGHTFNLPGYAGGASLPNVMTFIQGKNSGSFTTEAYVDDPATASAFTGTGTTCLTP
jgi:large repetitive protein